MGFMDKVVSKAQEVGKAGQAKVDEMQTKRHLEDLFRRIGALTYAARSGREAPEDAATIDKLVAEITQLESAHPDLVTAARTTAADGSAGSAPGTFGGPGGAPVAVVPSAFSGAGAVPTGSSPSGVAPMGDALSTGGSRPSGDDEGAPAD